MSVRPDMKLWVVERKISGPYFYYGTWRQVNNYAPHSVIPAEEENFTIRRATEEEKKSGKVITNKLEKLIRNNYETSS